MASLILVIIGLSNALAPKGHQAISWTNSYLVFNYY